MSRLSGLVVAAVLAGVVPVKAESWAEKMFDKTTYNFGAVARAAKIEHEFVLTNRYKEDIHIASVRSSCGCTAPTITKEWLKSREKSSILAAFNTRTFSG